jgi:hypothetical protein
MTSEHRDRIVKTFLEEIVGGNTPPDLTDQILRQLELRAQPTSGKPQQFAASDLDVASDLNGTDHAMLPASCLGSSQANTEEPQLVVRAAQKMRLRQRDSRWFLWNSVAAIALVALTVFLVYAFWDRNQNPDQQLAKDAANTTDVANGQASALPKTDDVHSSQLVTDNRPNPLNPAIEQPVIMPVDVQPIHPDDVRTTDIVNSQPRPQLPPLVLAEPIQREQLVALIDNKLDHLWVAHQLAPASGVSDAVWAERLVHKLTGREINKQELTRLAAISSKTKRQEFFDWLFTQPDVLDEFANLWSRRLATHFLGREVGVEEQLATNNPPTAHLLAHLRYSIYNGTPYDKLATELLTATGSIEPLKDDYDGAVGYLISISRQNKDRALVSMTSQVVRSFWGQRLQCAQCHDDQAAGLTQQEFWNTAALLRDFQISPSGGSEKIVAEPYPSSPLFYEAQDGRVIAIAPELTSGNDSSRPTLAQQLIRNPLFAQQAINIVWSEMLGYGLVNPPGDLGSHNPSIDVELNQTLAEQFRSHEYSLREVINWIALSTAFDRPTNDDSQQDHPEATGVALFSRYYQREPKNPDVVERSLTLVMNAYTQNRTDPSGNAKKAILARRVSPADSPGQVAVSQDLPIGTTEWGTSDAYAATMQKIVESSLSDQNKVEHLFWLAQNRSPDGRELSICISIVKSNEKDSRQAYQDIWWAISNR